ncbi:hypothetical protein BJP37_00940 [Moorena bouillonii PNG]|uniref:Uncharacterized protein n=1 Tax=Moorena bouillonii PNG TaxID=568701 RepID=A0A1U7MVV4_9CYAN|nr:hypothetical protein BJP37_00940 [Moorena bouillonii PNG]
MAWTTGQDKSEDSLVFLEGSRPETRGLLSESALGEVLLVEFTNFAWTINGFVPDLPLSEGIEFGNCSVQ